MNYGRSLLFSLNQMIYIGVHMGHPIEELALGMCYLRSLPKEHTWIRTQYLSAVSLICNHHTPQDHYDE